MIFFLTFPPLLTLVSKSDADVSKTSVWFVCVVRYVMDIVFSVCIVTRGAVVIFNSKVASMNIFQHLRHNTWME